MRKIKFNFWEIFLVIAVSGCGMPTRTCVAKGNKEFKKGNFAESVKEFEEAKKKSPDSDIVNYDLGTAHYKNGNYKSAEESLQNALLTNDSQLKEKAHYNLGNTFFQSGIAQKDKDIKAAIGELEKAVQQYESALAIDDKDDQAKNNLDVTEKKIEELKKIQQQQKQQKQQDQKNQQGQQGQQGQQNQQRQGPSSGKDNPQNSQQNFLQDQSGQSQSKKDQEKSQQDQSGQSKSGENTDDQGKISAQNENRGETGDEQEQGAETGAEEDMNQKEAERLLRSYQEKEEPKGLPNFMRGSGGEKPVQKDW